MNSIIQIEEVTKKYHVVNHREGMIGAVKDIFRPETEDIIAVDKLSFSVEEGEILGLIGPNGSGKSTTIKMLIGILKKDQGGIKVFGKAPFENRKEIVADMGIMFGQKSQLWWDIPLINSYELLRDIYHVRESEYRKNINELIDCLDLAKLMHKPVREMSLGQRMRSELAAIFIHNPKIAILDEPTIGLDIIVKKSIREYILRHNQKYGTTVLLTTHDMNDIASLCKNIVVINRGKKIYSGSIQKVKNELDDINNLKVILENGVDAKVKMKELGFMPREIFMETGEKSIEYSIQFKKGDINKIIQMLSVYKIYNIQIEEPSFEDAIGKLFKGES